MLKLFIRTVRSHLTEHVDLIPLFGAYAFTASMSVGIMVWTSLAKQDVIYNRWTDKNYVINHDPNKFKQKLYVPPNSLELYRNDPVVDQLRSEVYSDGRYLPSSHEAHH